MTDYDIELIASLTALVFVAAAFSLSAAIQLRKRHRDAPAWRVHAGAFVYGLMFGAIFVFGVLPLRVTLTSGEVPDEMTAVSGVAIFGIIIAIRRGILARLPLIGQPVRAYRRAALRRSIEDAEKALEKLTPSS